MENNFINNKIDDNPREYNQANTKRRRNTYQNIPGFQFLSSNSGKKNLNSKRHSIMVFNNFEEMQDLPEENNIQESINLESIIDQKQSLPYQHQNPVTAQDQIQKQSSQEQKKIKLENQQQKVRDYQNFMRQFEKKKKQNKTQKEDLMIFWKQKIYPVQKYDFQVYYDEQGNRKWNFHEVTEKEMKKQEQDEEIQKLKEKQELLKKMEFQESEQQLKKNRLHQKMMKEIEDQWKSTQYQQIQFINTLQKKNFSVIEQQNQEIKKSQSQDAFQSKKIMARDQYTIRKVLSSVPVDKLKWIMDEKKKNFHSIQEKLLKNPFYKLKPQIKPTLSFYSKTSAQFNKKNLSSLMQQENGSQQITQFEDNNSVSFRQTSQSCFDRLYTQKTASFLNKKFNINNPNTQSFQTSKGMQDTNGFKSSISTAFQTPSSFQDPYQFQKFKMDSIMDQDDSHEQTPSKKQQS